MAAYCIPGEAKPSSGSSPERQRSGRTPGSRRREAAEAGLPEEGEAQEGEGGEEAEEVGDPDGGFTPPFPLILAFRKQRLLTGSDPRIFPSSHTIRPATGTMASTLVLDAHVAYPVGTVPAPAVVMPVFPTFAIPGCHHCTSQLASPPLIQPHFLYKQDTCRRMNNDFCSGISISYSM